MNIHRYLAALLIAPALTLTQPSLAQRSKPDLNQELTMYAKPAVVRVMRTCYGVYKNSYDFEISVFQTGFLISPDGYIVTSANFLSFNQDKCRDRLSRNIAEAYEDKLKDVSPEEIDSSDFFKVDYKDIVTLPKVGTKELTYKLKYPDDDDDDLERKPSENIAIIKVPVTNAPTLKLGDSSQVKIQDRILTVGYPYAADPGDDYTKELMKEESFYEASVIEGRVSNPNKKLSDGNPIVQVDIRAEQGSVGSPILNKKSEVVGMLVRDQKDSDFNTIPLAIPTSTIWEYIRQSGATNKSGTTDEYYREGLHLYWKGNYKKAKTKFLNVKELFKVGGVSAHAEVERLIGEIDQIEADWWAKPWTNPTYLLMMGLFTGGGVVAAVAYFLLRHQSSARKASPVSAGASAEDRSTSTNSYKNGVGSSQSWLELEYKGQIRRFQLDRDEHRLGRDPAWSDFDIPTSWEVVSRHHAILRKEGEDYRIYDGDGKVPSRNGLWIDDDARVDYKDGYPLENGDRLKIGQDAHEQIILTYYNPNNYQANLKTTRMAD